MKNRSAFVLPACAIIATIALVHCSNSDLIIGDDSPTLPADGDGGDGDPSSPLPDGSSPIEHDDAGPHPTDAGKDANKVDAAPSCDLPSTCIPSTDKCKQLGPNNGKGCASASQVCCAQTCPTLSPPAPGFCDGGPTAPIYDSSGCIVGYGCAPMTCAAGGGGCVALVPGGCPSNNIGDANKYSCGGGLGVMCCLP